MWLQGLGVAKPALLLAMLGAEAVGGRAASVSLEGGHQMSQILVKVLDVPVCLVADVGINLWSWCISNVAAIWEDGRVGGGDKLVSVRDDLCVECFTGTIAKLLHIWCIR